MTLYELSIFVQNKKGKLTSISKLMGEAAIDIRGFSMVDTAEGYGIFRLLVNDNAKAVRILQEHNFTVSETEVLVVMIPDSPGALYETLKLFSDNEINLEYIYPVANSAIVIKLDDFVKAYRILEAAGIKIIKNSSDI
ncbi:MAG: amino acid-binding protein [Spirochaetae bacterium HGW-Spirochaetae-6]|jgi:hypothetical protein|nr:MAG: amino acid-binding protein [Spirochaetae bacterium HGW-Spirochaetae-6]